MSAIDDFVKQSATSYLQSVVFVDDKIYESAGGRPLESSPVAADLGRSLKPQFGDGSSNDAVDAPSNVASDNDGATPAPENSLAGMNAAPEAASGAGLSQYHPRELMESFAQKGIVCALYEPREHFTTDPQSVLFSLCERADVIILDWDLYNDDGDGASALLAELIKKSEAEFPHHVRLCALYTNKPSLHPVMDALLAKLTERRCSVEVDQGKLHLIAGATRISIFGKPVSVGRPPDDDPYVVKESDLADKIIAEFASLHHGLMPAFALHGLAAVRRSTKRLLDKFRSELDGAFVLHRALVLGDTDAVDELPELLSDEIRAVLEDCWPSSAPIEEITTALTDSVPLADLDRPWKTKNGQPYDAKPVFREMLRKGVEGLDRARDECGDLKELKKGQGFRGIKPVLLKDFEALLTIDGRRWSDHLAVLFCNRTQYGADARTLRFGTVVRHKVPEAGTWNYSVCLMPICDSQRLEKPSSFPFWRLKDNAKDGVSAKRSGIVVVDAEGQTHCLAAGGKIRDMLWIQEFTPSASRSVTAERNENRFRFASANMIVEWVAELKPLHAQRIAAHMGAEISRVGLVESEWLRLFCDR